MLILVEPQFIDVVIKAADKAGFPHDRILLFSDDEAKPLRGIQDWRAILGSHDKAENWRWHRMTPEESKSRIAVLNYSSGYYE